jgi:hypothetical protein
MASQLDFEITDKLRNGLKVCIANIKIDPKLEKEAKQIISGKKQEKISFQKLLEFKAE